MGTIKEGGITRCYDCEGINLNGCNLYCYELKDYIYNLDVIHSDCPLSDIREVKTS